MERRLKSSPSTIGKLKPTPLPLDFLKLVVEVFRSTYVKDLKRGCYFEANGEIYPDEVVLAVSLISKNAISATTIYASIDFDPQARGFETMQKLLGTSVDAIAAVFEQLKVETLSETSLNDIESAPFEWTPVVLDKQKIFVKIDKANPKLELMADEWLELKDPDLVKLQKETDQAMKDLFVTGPKKPGQGSGNKGNLH